MATKTVRPAHTYRAARRNEWKYWLNHKDPAGQDTRAMKVWINWLRKPAPVVKRKHLPEIRPNRSRKWA